MRLFFVILYSFLIFSNVNAFSQESYLNEQNSWSQSYSYDDNIDWSYNFDYTSSFSSWENSFDTFMNDFESNLNSQLNQMEVDMEVQIENMMNWIMSQVDLHLESTFELIDELSKNLPDQVTDLLDSRFESYFNILNNKFDSETTFSKLEKLETAIDKKISKWNNIDDQTLDLLKYMSALTQVEKWEIVKEEANAIIDSGDGIEKEDLSDIKSLFEQLNIQ